MEGPWVSGCRSDTFYSTGEVEQSAMICRGTEVQGPVAYRLGIWGLRDLRLAKRVLHAKPPDIALSHEHSLDFLPRDHRPWQQKQPEHASLIWAQTLAGPASATSLLERRQPCRWEDGPEAKDTPYTLMYVSLIIRPSDSPAQSSYSLDQSLSLQLSHAKL